LSFNKQQYRILQKGKCMTSRSISCQPSGCGPAIKVPHTSSVDKFLQDMTWMYHASTTEGDSAAQYWADTAVNSKNPLAPLANIPGVFAAL
jgi:hypothetical protein